MTDEREPRRIQRQRTAGWRMPEGVKYVGRPTRWANPISISGNEKDSYSLYYGGSLMGAGLTRAQAHTAAVRHYLSLVKPERMDLSELRGLDLACWCPLEDADGTPLACHADALLELANKADPR